MTENKNNYQIIIELKNLNNKLLQCSNYDEVDTCRYELLSYIENHTILKDIYKNIIASENSLKSDGEYNTLLNKMHTYVIGLLNLATKYKTFKILRTKVFELHNLEKIELIENDTIIGEYTDFPNLAYYPSLTMLFPPKDYLQLVKQNNQFASLNYLYKLFDETFQMLLNIMTLKYNFDFYLLNKHCFNIGLQENNFNAAFLYCIVKTVNLLLQNLLIKPSINVDDMHNVYENNKTEQASETKLSTQNNIKSPLDDEQIKILTLRKHLSPDNTYTQMIKYLPGINLSNLKRIASKINTILGANNIDESLRIFESKYFELKSHN